MRSISTLLFFLVLALGCSLITTPALATDGVLEINQTCGENTGCFAGDTAGLPVTITASGSYRLTSNLIVPDESTDGIKISTSDVGIDLNNFAIIRSGCEGATTACTPVSGTGSGVERTLTWDRGISVKNGTITGMGGYGVQLGAQAEVTNLRVRWNRLDGISAVEGASISGNTAYGNGSGGIAVTFSSTVLENAVFQNGSSGISVDLGSTVSGNTASANGNAGILATIGATIAGNSMYLNGGDGISTGDGATVSGNTSYANQGDGISTGVGTTVSGNTAYFNTGDGISVGAGAAVRHNSVRSNQAHGLNLTASSPYSDNSITFNTVGGVNSGANRGGNYCSGTAVVAPTCP